MFGLEVAADKRLPPTEFRVFPSGPFETTKGTFVFSKRSAESVMSWYNGRQLPLMGDYEHMTDEPAMGRPPVIAPLSIMQMTPVVRANAAGEPELWVTDVKWTKRATQMLEEGEYRFFSPTFLHDPETKEVLALLRIALTNDPAIDDLAPLVAASSAAGDGNENTDERGNTMADEASNELLTAIKEQHKALKDQHEDLLGKHRALGAQLEDAMAKVKAISEVHETMAKSFEQWAAEESEEHEEAAAAAQLCNPEKTSAQLAARIITRLRVFARDVKALTGQKTCAAALGTMTAWKSGAAESVALKAEAEKSRLATLTAEYAAIADQAVADGKLPPAVRATYDRHVAERGIEFGLECLRAHVGAVKTPIVATSEIAPPSPDTSQALTTLSSGVATELATLFPALKLEDAGKQFNAYRQTLPKVLAQRAEK